MNRRDFSLTLVAGGAAALALPRMAAAQGGPQAGRDFVQLQTPVRVNLPAGKKVEVIEFFWYGCPACFAFEPSIESWSKRLPADVSFRHVPFAFIGPAEHQKLFYALEELGQREALQRRIFNHIHVQRKRLNSESDIIDFVAANGVDKAKFEEAWKSFSVGTRVSRGRTLSNDYKIDGVPSVAVQGRFYTSPQLAGGAERALAVVDALIQRARQAG